MKAPGNKQDLISLAARFIRENHPATVAVAFMELDCRCIKMCGFSAGGQLLSPVTLVLDRKAISKDRPPVCSACSKDGGISLQRLVGHGLIWTGAAAGRTSEDLRLRLGRQIFGDRYEESAPLP